MSLLDLRKKMEADVDLFTKEEAKAITSENKEALYQAKQHSLIYLHHLNIEIEDIEFRLSELEKERLRVWGSIEEGQTASAINELRFVLGEKREVKK